jgi:hypothetical protein
MRYVSWLSDFAIRMTCRAHGLTCREKLRRTKVVVARVESLETRTLLSAVTWTGGAGTMNWNDPANWSTNDSSTPSAADDVSIGNLGTNPILIAGAAVNIHSLTSYTAMEIADTSLTLADTSNFNRLVTVDAGASLIVQSGTVTLLNGGLSNGNYSVASGANLDLFGTYNLAATSSVTGAGTVDFVGANASVAGSYAITGSTFVDYSTVDFTGTVLSVGDTLAISNGSSIADFHTASLSVQTLNMAAGTLNAGDVTVSKQFLWNNGTISGAGTLTVQNNGSISPNLLLGDDVTGYPWGNWTIDGKTLDNQGQAVVSLSSALPTGLFDYRNGATFLNAGSFTVQSSSDVQFRKLDSSATAFVNTGTFTMSPAAAQVEVGVTFDNAGTVSIQKGTVSLGNGGSSSGTFLIATGAELDLSGTHNLATTSGVSGAGKVDFIGANASVAGSYSITGSTFVDYSTVDFTGTVLSVGDTLAISNGATADFHTASLSAQTLNLTAGTLNAGDVTVSKQFLWNNGTISGAGTLTVQNNGSISPNLLLGDDVTGYPWGNWTIDGKTLDSQGQAVLSLSSTLPTGYFDFRHGATFLNEGAFTVQNATDVFWRQLDSAPVSVVNHGTFTMASSAAGIEVGLPFNNTGTVVLQNQSLFSGYVQTAGTTTLAGGTISIASPLDIQGGLLIGSGTVNGGISNSANTSPGAAIGLLNIAGDYAQLSTGKLSMEFGGVSAGTLYDQLDVSHDVMLSGGLQATLTNGFVPVAGQSFTIIKNDGTNAVNGTFAGLSQDASLTISGRLFQISYSGGDGNDVTLTAMTDTSDANPSILLLDATGKGALTASGNGQIIVGGSGHIVVASINLAAVVVSGNGSVKSAELEIESTTGTQLNGNGKVIGVIDRGVAASVAADPLSGLAVPPSTGTQFSAANITGNTVVTLQPGTYTGGIHISGNARVTLSPGVYYMKGGGFSVAGNAVVTGNGVFIYNAPASVKDTINISGDATVTLTAMTTGSYQGIALFQSRNSNAVVTIAGNGVLNLTGTLYTAAAAIGVSGNGRLSIMGATSELIAADLSVAGNGIVKLNP